LFTAARASQLCEKARSKSEQNAYYYRSEGFAALRESPQQE